MTYKSDDILQILHGLIAQFPERAGDGDWLAAEASEIYGIDPHTAKQVYDKRLRIWDA